MSARCPEGHLSESLDYCDTCGSPMGAAPGPDPQPGMPPHSPALPPPGAAGSGEDGAGAGEAAATQTCPHCGESNVVDALFCESCGYDFTTGTPPMGSEPVETVDEPQSEVGPEPEIDPEPKVEPEPVVEPDVETPLDVEAASESESGTELEVESETELEVESETDQEDEVESQIEPENEVEPEVEAEPLPEPQPETELPPEPAPGPDVPAHRQPRHTPPSRALADTWVVELWVDPDWYAVQQTEEGCPSPGMPDTVLLTRSTALVGRPSGSRGVRPEVDAGADSAVSRRHAQLTSDGRRWWVEDLGSSNGTFVGTVGQPLPTTALTPGQRVEIDRDDRIYIGAWTRLVLRQATESERRGTG
ncbi:MULTISPECIES: FHA domain-containing protein [unclassified Ornithinimicrobium]|uniref:FHA domain-containing protein n=1 Tax=unclassified Ornithinimicrobium TaxID=2615080 RepID=UPI0038523513